jgi:hypothetical protein
MFKILETYMTEILLAVLVLAFLAWSGYLIASEIVQTERLMIACIEAGNQVIDGDCVK